MAEPLERNDEIADVSDTAGPASPSDLVVTRSEEELHVTTVWQPFRRVRIRKRLVTEMRTVEVEVEREELVLEDLDVPPGQETVGDAHPGSPLVFILHEEHLVVDRVRVPVERVTVTIEPVTSAVDVRAVLARERVVEERM